MSELFNTKTVRAKKQHRCDECRKTIEVGERYDSWFQLFDGDVYSGHTCLVCEDMRRSAWDAFDWFDAEEAAPLGQLRSFLVEEHDVKDVDDWYAGILTERERVAAEKALITSAARSYAGEIEG